MTKFLRVVGKTVLFYAIWLLLVAVIDWPVHDPVLWRLNAEMVPLAILIVLSIVFWIIDRRKTPIFELNSPIKSIFSGLALGFSWVTISFGILFVSDQLSIIGTNTIGQLELWILACFINVCMQELLIRGYTYQLLRKNYSVWAGIIINTAIFVFLHGSAFEAGTIAILNVLTMSLFMFFAYEATESWLFITMVHFAWNAIGGIFFGAVNLAEDYPSIIDLSVNGPSWLSGGDAKLEGSIVVLIFNLILIFRYAMKWRYKERRKRALLEEQRLYEQSLQEQHQSSDYDFSEY